MATAETQAETPDIPPELLEEGDWREDVKKDIVGLWMAHRGLDVKRVQQNNAIALATMKFAASGDKAQLAADIERAATMEAEDMGVSIGNKEVHYHYSSAQAAQANTTTQAPEAAPLAASNTTNTLGKIAAAGALLGAGGLGALGVGMAVDYLTKPEPAVIVQPAEPGIDTDTNAGLRFKD
jgi:hypothetical protein